MHRPRKHEAVDEMSWRDTLFVWRSDVEYLDNIMRNHLGEYYQVWRGQPIKGSTFKHLPGPEFRWRGRWIGVDSADATKADMPPVRDWRDGANAFESDNNFNVRGDMVQYKETDGGPVHRPSYFRVMPNEAGHDALASPQEGSGWQLDNGEGHRWYGDTVHEIRWCGDDLVFARGHNEFAPFVSVGFLSGYRHHFGKPLGRASGGFSKCNRTLTVARRYLDDRDERCGWSMDDLEREVRAAAASSSPKHPWMVDCMGTARMKKRKR